MGRVSRFPLGQETGAVTTGSQWENHRGRIPTTSPLLSSTLLLLLGLLLSPHLQHLRVHTIVTPRGVSRVLRLVLV